MKAQLVIIYPRNYANKLKIKAGKFLEGIEVQKVVEVLGVQWQQPRFYKKGRIECWFQEYGKTIEKKI